MKFLLFPGQGRPESALLSRQHGPKAKLVEWIERRLGRTLSTADFSDNVAYSALLIADGIATCQRYVEAGGEFEGVAGYSTGQFAALAAAGCLNPEQTLDLVIRRAEMMIRSCGDGFGMLSVLGLELRKLHDAINELSGKALYISTKNGPFSFSVSGAKGDLLALKESLETTGLAKKCAFLPVAGAWHSPALSQAAKEFAAVLESVDIRAPRTLFWDNVTGTLVSDSADLRNNLIRHLVAPVEWDLTIRNMRKRNPAAWIECGAGNQLRQMLFFIDRTVPSFGMHSEDQILQCAALPG